MENLIKDFKQFVNEGSFDGTSPASKYIIPKTIERDRTDMSDLRNHPPKKIKYRGFTIEKDWLDFYTVNGFTSNNISTIHDYIDQKIEENPDLENDSDETI